MLMPANRILPIPASLVAAQPRTMSPDICATDFERAAYDFFRLRGVEALYRVSPTRDWVNMMLQFSTTEPAVFESVVAFATVQDSISLTMHKSMESPAPRRNLDLAMHQFSKASTSLRRYIDRAAENEAEVTPVLLCCILFVCFELIRGKLVNALAHLDFGRQIIQDMASSSSSLICGNVTSKSGLTLSSSEALQSLTHALFFIGQDAVFPSRQKVLDQDSAAQMAMSTSIPQTFNSLPEAKQCLNILTDASKKLREELVELAEEQISLEDRWKLHPAVVYCISQCLSHALLADSNPHAKRIRNLIEAHHAWVSASSGLEAIPAAENPFPFQQLTLLKLQHAMSLITLETYMDTHETVWNRYTATFNQLLEQIDRLLESIARSRIPGVTGPLHRDAKTAFSFSLEPAVLPVLSLIAAKGRDHQIRRRATSLLRSAGRMEGLMFSTNISYFQDSLNEAATRYFLSRSQSAAVAKADTQFDPPDEGRFLEWIAHGESREPKFQTRFVCGRFADESEGQLEITQFMATAGPGEHWAFEPLGHFKTAYYAMRSFTVSTSISR
jgi:hypothetical protein